MIEVNNLSKSYRLGHNLFSYRSLRDEMVSFTKKPVLWLRGNRELRENFWALKDISFSVEEGEVLGIIGRNGAGKTTLLKILSQITPPTKGEAVIKGRVSSLLEVGTGFHPELTGKENIYFNGALLGMTKKEINSKFDEIVNFAELEKFLETPVKRYSSGMYVRLAFAIAAHLEPEILLVDEVLAVGDTAFQKKCLGKMNKVAQSGRTILFISHNMAAIENLCTRAIVLDEGKKIFEGETKKAIDHYLFSYKTDRRNLRDFSSRKGNGELRIVDLKFRNKDGKIRNCIPCGEPMDILMEYENYGLPNNTEVFVTLYAKTVRGTPLFETNNKLSGLRLESKNIGKRGFFVCHINSLALTPSTYFLDLYIKRSGQISLDEIPGARKLDIEMSNFLGSGQLPSPAAGPLVLKTDWKVEN
ncbi:ABC transporter ATP-binding protein [Patescibacteria group bacterium]|nr:ABC transporter ATP-binding protein [Patescibacteria group bacterium]